MRRPVLLRLIRTLGGTAIGQSEAAASLAATADRLATQERTAELERVARSWSAAQQRALDNARQLAESAKPALDGWSSTRWTGFRPTPGSLVPSFGLRLGGTGDVGPAIGAWLHRPLGPTAAEQRSLEVVTRQPAVPLPLTAPFSPRESFTLLQTQSKAGYDAAVEAVQSAIWRLVGTTAPDLIQIDIVDTRDLGASAQPLLELPETLRGRSVVATEDGVRALLTGLQEHARDVLVEATAHRHRDLWAYNAANPEVARPFRLLVVFGYPMGFSQQTIDLLDVLIGAGPPAGIGGLLVTAPGVPLPYGATWPKNPYRSIREVAPPGSGWVLDLARPAPGAIAVQLDRLPPQALRSDMARAAERELAAVANRAITRQAAGTTWSERSVDRLVTEVGKYANQDPIIIQIDGKELPHLLVGGKTGWGKSVFLHNLITGLAERYSPDELQYYLVDLKDGVEFQVYTDLPHARAIINRANPAWALAVLKGLLAIKERRSEAYKAAGQALADYETHRAAFPGEPHPRIVCIVDEFQLLLNDPDLGSEGAATLLALVQQGRSFGIHVVLATQAWDGNLKGVDEIRNQIGTRVALYLDNPISSAGVLGAGNTIATRLKKAGDVAVTTRPGDPNETKTGRTYAVGRADAQALSAQLAQRARQAGYPPRLTFRIAGDRSPGWPGHAGRLLARLAGAGDGLHLLLGRPIRLDADVAATLAQDVTEGMLIFGHDEALAARLLTGICLSATGAAQAAVRILAPGPLQPTSIWGPLLALDKEARDGANWQLVQEGTLAVDRLGALQGEIARRQGLLAASQPVGGRVLIVLPALDRWPALMAAEADGGDGIAAALRCLITDGPAVGVHPVAQARAGATFERLFSYDADRIVRQLAHRAVLRCQKDESYHLLGNERAAGIGDRVALYHNLHHASGGADLIEPYDFTGSAFDVLLKDLERSCRLTRSTP